MSRHGAEQPLCRHSYKKQIKESCPCLPRKEDWKEACLAVSASLSIETQQPPLYGGINQRTRRNESIEIWRNLSRFRGEYSQP